MAYLYLLGKKKFVLSLQSRGCEVVATPNHCAENSWIRTSKPDERSNQGLARENKRVCSLRGALWGRLVVFRATAQ